MIFKKLNSSLLNPSQGYRTGIPVLMYVSLFLLRNHWSPYGCHKEVSACFSLPFSPIDRWISGPYFSEADFYSTFLQNSMGMMALLLPYFYFFILAPKKRSLIWKMTQNPVAWMEAFQHTLLFIQVTFWNGIGVELARLLFPRLRPYGYIDLNPVQHDFLSYSSFYSGHTSFTAAAGTFLILSLMHSKAPRWLLGTAWTLSQGFIFLTAILRVLAGKHFFSDVLTGILAGTMMAFFVFSLYRKREGEQSIAF